MTDRPASWRMPTPKQMEKLAAEATRRPTPPAAAPDAPLPAEYWDALLKDPRAGDGVRIRERKLSEIHRHVLRVSCRRCERTVEIQTVDAVRLYGGKAVWKDVGLRAHCDARRSVVTRQRARVGYGIPVGSGPDRSLMVPDRVRYDRERLVSGP
jgi:hypothetical protein